MLRQVFRLACAVVLLAGVLVTPGAAQTWDKRTHFTFTAPVAVPGVTLPAGEYIFRLASPDTSRTVVQVLSADGAKPYGMFFTYPARRIEPAETPEVRFMETAKGMPAAIRTWWYPGERTGYEFIYPKEQARLLAQGASQSVLTTQAQTTTTEQTNTTELTRMSSTGVETNLEAGSEPVAAAPGGTTQGGTVAASSISITNPVIPPAVANTGTQIARARLPETASMMPIVAIVGAIALMAGVVILGIRRYREERASV